MDLKAAVNARHEPKFEDRLHRKAVVCIGRKLLAKFVDGDPIDDRFIVRWRGLRSSTRPTPIWRSFGGELKRICRAKGSISEDDFFNVYNRLVEPIDSRIWPITRALIGLTPNPFGGPSLREIKQKIPECRAVKPIYQKSNDRNSIYWCLRGWIRPALRDCFEDPESKISPF